MASSTIWTKRRTATTCRPAGTCGILLIAFVIAGFSDAPHRALAASPEADGIIHLVGSNPDLTLLCPGGEIVDPEFQNRRTGEIFPISNPQLRAVAKKACSSDLDAAATETQPVKIINHRAGPVYVGYSGGGAIHWSVDAGCIAVPNGVEIKATYSCFATVISTNSGSRFCASLTTPPNCTEAQQEHVTLIEPTFDTSDHCTYTGQPGACVSYDISVIPMNCTDALWGKDKCADAGGASYNLPVEMSCPEPGSPVFSCQGPPSSLYGSAEYPSRCGNPDASCVGNTHSCVMAYFHPMFSGPYSNYKHQPVGTCAGGRTLVITFLSGP